MNEEFNDAIDDITADDASVDNTLEIEDAPEDVEEDVPEDMPEDVPEDVEEDVPEDMPEDIEEDVSSEENEKTEEDMLENISEDTEDGAARNNQKGDEYEDNTIGNSEEADVKMPAYVTKKDDDEKDEDEDEDEIDPTEELTDAKSIDILKPPVSVAAGGGPPPPEKCPICHKEPCECIKGSNDVKEKSAIDRMADYMNAHNYGLEHKDIYMCDPEWIAINRDLKAELKIPQTVQERMADYMGAHNYGLEHKDIYMSDPEWIAINRDLQAELGLAQTENGGMAENANFHTKTSEIVDIGKNESERKELVQKLSYGGSKSRTDNDENDINNATFQKTSIAKKQPFKKILNRLSKFGKGVNGVASIIETIANPYAAEIPQKKNVDAIPKTEIVRIVDENEIDHKKRMQEILRDEVNDLVDIEEARKEEKKKKNNALSMQTIEIAGGRGDIPNSSSKIEIIDDENGSGKIIIHLEEKK